MNTIRFCLGGLFALSALAQASAQTLATHGRVVAGEATFTQKKHGFIVNQTSDKLITNWRTFDINASDTVTFRQPNANSVALNRVIGVNSPSQINGRLVSNGKVFLVNPNGVFIGGGASVNVGSLVVSTLDILDKDFLSGNYRFSGPSEASIVNKGRLFSNAKPGQPGFVALIANEVENRGIVRTKSGGAVVIGAGSDVTLELGGPLRLKVNAGALNAQINNLGELSASGGFVGLYADQKAAGLAINQQGLVSAGGLDELYGGKVVLWAPQGDIFLGGTTGAQGAAKAGSIDVNGQAGSLGGSLLADSRYGEGGSINVTLRDLLVQASSGEMDVSGGLRGGQVALESGYLQLEGHVNASALASGGVISVKGNEVQVGTSSVIRANGWRGTPNRGGVGGQITVWGQNATNIRGNIQATPGAGQTAGTLDIGSTGSLFIGPDAFLVASVEKGTGGTVKFTADRLQISDQGPTGSLTADMVRSQLDLGVDLHLRAINDLSLEAPINSTSDGGQLHLTAGRSIDITAPIQLGNKDVFIVANAQEAGLQATRGAGEGHLILAGAGSLTTKGKLQLKVDGNPLADNAGVMRLGEIRASELLIDSARFRGTLDAQGRRYDGTTAVQVNGQTVDGLELVNSNLSLGFVGAAFVDKQAGKAKRLHGGISVKGFDASAPERTAQLQQSGQDLRATGVADIAAIKLTLRDLLALNKTYDGNADATVQAGGDDRIAGDQFEVLLDGRFDNKHAGAGKTVRVSAASLRGADAGNYVLEPDGDWIARASITPRLLHVSAPSSVQWHPALSAGDIALATDALAGDALKVSGSRWTLGGAAGRRQLTLSELRMDGAAAGDYVLAQPSVAVDVSLDLPMPLRSGGGWACAQTMAGCGHEIASGGAIVQTTGFLMSERLAEENRTTAQVMGTGIRVPEEMLKGLN